MQKLLLFVDKISTWVGHAFSFFIVALTLHVAWEVFLRYALDSPRAWAFDVMIMFYGALFNEVLASQRAFAQRAVRWYLDTQLSGRMAYNYYFAKPAAPQKS